MIFVTINRHCVGRNGSLGHKIADYDWPTDVVPRVGEIVTVHPTTEISEESWSGEVTGVQYVFARGVRAHLTVLDSTERAMELARTR